MRNIILAIAMSLAGGCAPVYPMHCGPDVPTEYACEGWTPRRAEVLAVCATPGCSGDGYAICIHADPGTGRGSPPDRLGCSNGAVVNAGRYIAP